MASIPTAFAAPVSAMPADVMMPVEWYEPEMQFEMLAAGIKYPVYATAELEDKLDMHLPQSAKKAGIVYMPHFGNYSMRNLHEVSGGNPLTREDRKRMCLVITPPIEGLSYSRAFHGCPVFESDDDTLPVAVTQGQLPRGFRDNAILVQQQSLAVLARLSNQRFEVLGAKLSPLSSNRANIVIYVRFEHECPFDRQFYEEMQGYELMQQRRANPIKNFQRRPQGRGQPAQQQTNAPKVRIVPHPIISDDESIPCARFEVQFAHVDNGLFEHAYNYMQHLVEERLGMHLRHIRLHRGERKLQAVAQFTDALIPADFDKQVDELARYTKNPTFQPYLATSSLKHELIYVDNM